MKLGIVGFGHVAKYHIAAIGYVEGIELVAVCDQDAKKRTLKVPFYSSVDDLLASSDAEAVIVAVPNEQHYIVAKKVIESGRHAIIEKPVTKELSEFDELCELADRQRVMAYTAFHAAKALDVKWALANLAIDTYGPLTGFHAGFYDPYVVDGNLTPQGKVLEGSWIDSGINALSVISQFVDDLKIKEALFGNRHGYECEEITGYVEFTFGNGYHGSIDTNWLIGLNRKTTRLDFAKTDTTIILDHSNQRVLVNGQVAAQLGEGRERLMNHYLGVFADFLEKVAEGCDNRDYSRKCHELHLIASRYCP